MVSTPNKTSNKTVNDTKSNIMSQYQGLTDSTLFGSLQTKPGDYESVGSVMNGSVVNFIDFLSGEELILGDTSQVGTPAYEQYTSSNTPSSLVYDISTPRDVNDSFLSTDSFYSNDSFYNDSFNSTDSPMINASFLSSPLDPALDFFPDLIDSDASRSLVQLTTGIPSVTIPVDDSPLTTVPSSSALSPALTIPWSTDATVSSSTETIHASSSPSILSNYSSATSSPKTPSTIVSNKTSPQTTSSSPLKSNTRSRKRSISETEKDSQSTADELALKRAKNTDAARRSRLRKVMRMETLEKQVAELKAENTDLQTRIAVLESEKKGLEEKNAEKEGRVKMLEQHLAEAHERLIKRT